MSGDPYALLCLTLLGILIVFVNWQRLLTNQTAELTTSVALLVMGFAGILCGKGHTFTPAVIAILSAALLSWKEPLTDFSLGLTNAEMRSAILLSIITFVIYPVLPVKAIDPWHLIEPRASWMTVILIAALGFANYLLWKLYGAGGVMIGAFLGGLVNSTVAITDLSLRTKEGGEATIEMTYRGVMLATAAMIIRNMAILGLLAFHALFAVWVTLLTMLLACIGCAIFRRSSALSLSADGSTLRLESPFSMASALKFGFVFLVLSIAGALAKRFLGAWGFYAISFAGGLVSSASAVASAAILANHKEITPLVAGNGAVISSLASAIINGPLVARISNQRQLSRKIAFSIGAVASAGIIGFILQILLRS
jgi:uncharacterized membrane protein (DUF4010 family)